MDLVYEYHLQLSDTGNTQMVYSHIAGERQTTFCVSLSPGELDMVHMAAKADEMHVGPWCYWHLIEQSKPKSHRVGGFGPDRMRTYGDGRLKGPRISIGVTALDLQCFARHATKAGAKSKQAWAHRIICWAAEHTRKAAMSPPEGMPLPRRLERDMDPPVIRSADSDAWRAHTQVQSEPHNVAFAPSAAALPPLKLDLGPIRIETKELTFEVPNSVVPTLGTTNLQEEVLRYTRNDCLRLTDGQLESGVRRFARELDRWKTAAGGQTVTLHIPQPAFANLYSFCAILHMRAKEMDNVPAVDWTPETMARVACLIATTKRHKEQQEAGE